MKLYMCLFSRADGGRVEPLGVYFDFEQGRSAIRDVCVERHMAERPADPRLVAQEAAEAMTWRHYSPKPDEGRYLDLWIARDERLDYYLMWRCEGGERPWAQPEPTAELVKSGATRSAWSAALDEPAAEDAP